METIYSSVLLALATQETAWAVLILSMALFVRAAIGFGDGIIAVPLLSFLMPVSEAVPLVLFLGSSMSFIALWRHRQQIQLGSLGRTTLAVLVGFPLGALFLSQVDAALVKGLLGLMLVALAVWQLWVGVGRSLKGIRWSYLFGLLAGIFGSAYAMRGIVFAIYGNLRGWSPAQFKSTIHGFYVLSGLMLPVIYFTSGLVTQRVIGLFFVLLPPAIVATIAGGTATGKLDPQHFQRLIWWGLLVLGLLFVLNYLRMTFRPWYA